MTAQYTYDVFGRRIMKEVNGARTYFVYTDEGLIAEAKADGTITKTYGYSPNSTWGTNPVWMNVINSTTETNGYHWFQNDHMGTPQKLTSANGAVTWSATYDAFGKATVDATNSTVVNNLRFPGQYFDFETGNHQNWHRYYDPALGRYISADPLAVTLLLNTIKLRNYMGGEQSVFRPLHAPYDLFGYAKNNPMVYMDPNGRTPTLIEIGGAVVAVWAVYKIVKKVKGYVDLFKKAKKFKDTAEQCELSRKAYEDAINDMDIDRAEEMEERFREEYLKTFSSGVDLALSVEKKLTGQALKSQEPEK